MPGHSEIDSTGKITWILGIFDLSIRTPDSTILQEFTHICLYTLTSQELILQEKSLGS